MLDKQLALERLNQDKNYEDKLIVDLTEYFINCLDDIKDINSHEREQLKIKLNQIADDSRKHSFLFNELIELVLENEDNKY